MSTRRILAGAGAVLACSALVACGGSTTTQPTAQGTASASVSPSAGGGGQEGCTQREGITGVTGQTKNAQLLALGMSVYQSLDCNSTLSLTAQLEAASKNPDIVRRAKEIGATLSTQTVPEANARIVQFVVVSPSAALCNVSAWDSPFKMKNLHCQDA